MKSLMKEFREFAVKGNVIDLAVAVIIGAAFGKIVTSLVGDIIMPLLSLIVGGVRFQNLVAVVGGAEIRYGLFIQNVFDFLVIAIAIFIMLKFVNRLKRKEEVAPTKVPLPTREEVLLAEIRDLLKERRDIL